MKTKNDSQLPPGWSGQISARADVNAALYPEFGRAIDVERHFAIKRGLLYRWLREGKIRSISLREPGRRFGPRIFHMPEIRALLLKKLVSQNPEGEL